MLTQLESRPRESTELALDAARAAVLRAKAAQPAWAAAPLSRRLRVFRRLRREIGENATAWAGSITVPNRDTPADSLAAEVLPLAAACRFLELRARRILRTRKAPRRGRPMWSRSTRIRVAREPQGVVLIIGASNYPLFLTGVQAVQALAAGNAVVIKPGGGSSASARLLANSLRSAGLPQDVIQVLDESPESAQAAIEHGVDHIVLTGSAATGRNVLAAAAGKLTPVTAELSGCDVAFVLPGADLDRAARCLAFGLGLNGGATCIAPRRVLVHRSIKQPLLERLLPQVEQLPAAQLSAGVAAQAKELINDALAGGAVVLAPRGERRADIDDPAGPQLRPTVLGVNDLETEILRADLFAPVMSMIGFEELEHALAADAACPYALGASIFGHSVEAERLAGRLRAGCVTINDLIAPTADPEVPFGGAGESGFGVTRGREGLLAMTRPKVLIEQTGRSPRHLEPQGAELAATLTAYARAAHGRTWRSRFKGLWSLVSPRRVRAAENAFQSRESE